MGTQKEEELDTLPKLLRYRSIQSPDKVALREKDMGIWKRYTWKNYFDIVKHFSLGLASLGLKRGDKIAILGENKPEWYCSELAAQALGAIVIGIYTDCTPPEVKYYVEHSDSVFVICHDQEQVDKVLEVKNELPKLKKIIYWDPKGLWSYRDDLMLRFDEVIQEGKRYEEFNPKFFDQAIDAGKIDDIAVICYTSGTTGKPKGIMTNYRYLVGGTKDWSERDKWPGEGNNYVSFIPGAWAAEQTFGISSNLIVGITVNFPEKPETVQEDLREIGPDLLFYGARLWESLRRTVQAKMMDSTLPRKLMYRICLPFALHVTKLRFERKRVNPFLQILYFMAYHAFLRQLSGQLGLAKAKVVYSAGAAVSPDIIHFFSAMGVKIRLYYGTSELGTFSAPISGQIRPETSGRVFPWAEAKISSEGEILGRNKYMFCGYYKDEKSTRNKFEDGWYRTGDSGYIDEEGHLIVIDRMDDLQSLASGKKFSPQYAETRLRFSPFIKDAIVLGNKKVDYVTCMVNIDMETVGKFAEENHVEYTTFADLSQKSEIINLIKKEILKINRTLPDFARVKKFVNLDKELDADEEELTRTRKLRRSFVEERYAVLIKAIYSNTERYESYESVHYRDGRAGTRKISILVNRAEEEQQ